MRANVHAPQIFDRQIGRLRMWLSRKKEPQTLGDHIDSLLHALKFENLALNFSTDKQMISTFSHNMDGPK